MKWFYRLLGVTLYSIATGERAGRRAWKERGDRTEARVDEGIAGSSCRPSWIVFTRFPRNTPVAASCNT